MKALAIALVAALLLAGCASGKKDDDGNDSTGTSSGSKSGSASGSGSGSKSSTGTQTGSSGPGSITVDLTRSTPDGQVPLPVNLTLKATFKDGKGKEVPAPSGAAWTLAVFSGNSTTANSTLGKSGSTLPTNVTLNLTAAGNHTIRAEVSANGFTSGNDTVLVLASPAGSGAPLFFDGAEGDASQWTIASKVLVTNVAPMVPEQELAADHPSKYAASTDEAKTGTKSWHVAYNDNLRARMTSVAIPVPAGSHSLSYALKGGAEGTSIEGLFVLVGPADGALAVVAHHSGAAIDWTTFSVPVPASAGPSIKVQFRFDSDVSCSSGTATVPPEDPGGACGAGYDAGGYFIDDITVA